MDVIKNKNITKNLSIFLAIAVLATISLLGVMKMSFADDGSATSSSEELKPLMEEADEKLEKFPKDLKKRFGHKYHKTPWSIEDLKTKLQDAVDNGKLTQAEADEKLEKFQQGFEKAIGPK